MTCPRAAHLGASYRLVSRCIFRKHLLTPSAKVNQLMGYWLGVTSQRHGILVHAWMTMSNHIHLDVTDPNQAISAFLQDFKGTLARALNVHLSRWETVWSSSSGRQEVTTFEDALDGMVYTLTNPTNAGLVRHPNAWPGSCTRLSDIGATPEACATYTFRKPDFFFRKESDGGKLPDTITWQLAPHPLAASHPERFVKQLKARVATVAEAKRLELAKANKRFAGAARVEQRHWDSSPTTPAPRGQTRPLFACRDKKRRHALIQQHRAFVRAHTKARNEWLTGETVTFPEGTNQMRDYPGVEVANRAGPNPQKRAA